MSSLTKISVNICNMYIYYSRQRIHLHQCGKRTFSIHITYLFVQPKIVLANKFCLTSLNPCAFETCLLKKIYDTERQSKRSRSYIYSSQKLGHILKAMAQGRFLSLQLFKNFHTSKIKEIFELAVKIFFTPDIQIECSK